MNMDYINNLKKPLFSLELFEGTIINRPSKKIKSPYLADVLINNENILCHTPSLGCCGLVSSNKKVLMTKKNSKNAKSKYSIDFTFDKKTIVGVNPLYANKIVEIALKKNYIKELINLQNLKREYKIDESRFDFYGEKNNKKYYIEVKNVPLADFVDVDKKERKKYNDKDYEYNKKISYFPDGYRKKKTEPISVRALKHINHLKKIKLEDKNNECYLIFIIQRNDSLYFQASNIDPIYQKAIRDAYINGVKIIPIQILFDNNTLYFGKNMILRIN